MADRLHNGRQQIDGFGTPLEGIFKVPNQPSIVVDTEQLMLIPAYANAVSEMNLDSSDWKKKAIILATQMMPLGTGDHQGNSIISEFVDLPFFMGEAGQDAKATPNTKALMVALLVKAHIDKNKDGKVAVVKEGADSHAVVVIRNASGQEFKYDPTHNDESFVQILKVDSQKIINISSIGPRTTDAVSNFGSSDEVQPSLDEFGKGTKRIGYVVEKRGLRKAVFQDCTSVVEINVDTMKAYEHAIEKSHNKARQSQLFFDSVRGGLLIEEGTDSVSLFLYYNEVNNLEHVSISYPKDTEQILKQKVNSGLSIGELRTLAILAEINAKKGGSAFTVGLVGGYPTVEVDAATAIQELLKNVPNLFESSLR